MGDDIMRRFSIMALALTGAAFPSTASTRACIPVDPTSRAVFLSAADDFGTPNGLAFASRPNAAARQIELSGATGAPLLLVLSSATPKIWNLENVDKSLLRGVVMVGAEQAVAGILPNVPVASANPPAMRSPFGNPVSRCLGDLVGLGGERARAMIRTISTETNVRPMGFTALLKGSSFNLSAPDSTGDFRWAPIPAQVLVAASPVVTATGVTPDDQRPAVGDRGTHIAAWDETGGVMREGFPDSSRGPTDPEAMMPIGRIDVGVTTGRPDTSPFEAATRVTASPSVAPSSPSLVLPLLLRLLAAAAGVGLVVLLLRVLDARRRESSRAAEATAPVVPMRTPSAQPMSRAALEDMAARRAGAQAPIQKTPAIDTKAAADPDGTLRRLLDHVAEDDTVLALSRVRRAARISSGLDEDLAEERDRIVGPHLSGLVARYLTAAAAPQADTPAIEAMLRDSLGRLLSALEDLNEAQRRRGVDGLATSGAFIRERHPRDGDGFGLPA